MCTLATVMASPLILPAGPVINLKIQLNKSLSDQDHFVVQLHQIPPGT